MKRIAKLTVRYHGEIVGTLSLAPDNKLCTFEYDKSWLVNGFSISPLELPLKSGIFVAKPLPFFGNFGVFEDSLPDGYGRYLLHKTLLKENIDDTSLSVLDKLCIIGNGGMGHFKWQLTPAYDMTLCSEGYNGEHATSVNGNGRPTLQDMIAVGVNIKIPHKRCSQIIEEVSENCRELIRYQL